MQQTRKALVIHQGAELYGSDRMVIQLLSALHNSQKFDITLHIPNSGPLIEHIKSYCNTIIIHPISVLRLSLLKTLRWLNIKRFMTNLLFAYRQIKDHDTIIINTSVILSYILILPFCPKRKYIYIHEIPIGFIRLSFNILLWLSGAKLICNSQATSCAYPLIKNSKKYIVYNAIPDNNISYTKTDDTINLLLIGRLSHRKGHHILIKSLAHLNDEQKKSLSIRFVGSSFNHNDTYMRFLKSLINSTDQQIKIEFFPFSSDVQTHYEWSDIVIMPSTKAESFGLTALEAMQHGKAVIASAVGGLPEVVQTDQTGFLVEPNNPQNLAKAIKSYLSHPDLIKTHGIAGKNRATELFSLHNYNKNIVEVIYA